VRFHSLAWVAGWCIASSLGADAARSDDTTALVVSGAKLLSPEGASWLAGYALRVEEGRITAIAPEGEVELGSSDRHVDARGLHVVPGLIDLHSHLLLHPYDETSWNDQVLRENLELRVARGVAAARATLEAGFTTLRDLGTEGAAYADVGIREAIDRGLVPGPRVLASTRAIVATGCYGPSGFDPRFELPVGAQTADGVDGVRRATREQIAAGADWIKVYADYRRRPGDPSTPTFSLAELEAIVDEASSAGLPVAAHAVTDEAIRRAVLAGVRTIEHGYDASAETLALMRARGVTLCPTLAASESIARYAGYRPGDPEPERVRRARAIFGRALASGVRIACGSDVGVFAHGENARELELMVAYGMSPARALRSATSIAADVLGREDLGRLTEGSVADLVALRDDPLEDPAALRSPVLVVREGRVVVDRRGGDDEGAVAAVCRRWLELLSARRVEEAAQLLTPDDAFAAFQVAERRPRVVTRSGILDAARSGFLSDAGLREWIAGPPRVRVDRPAAAASVPYVRETGDARAAGTLLFQLVRYEGAWRICSITRTIRALGESQDG